MAKQLFLELKEGKMIKDDSSEVLAQIKYNQTSFFCIRKIFRGENPGAVSKAMFPSVIL